MSQKIYKPFVFLNFCFVFLLWVAGCSDGSGDREVVVEPPVNIEFNYQAKGQLVSFSATPSRLENGVTLEWDLGDGHRDTGFKIVHYYSEPGTYTVRATLTDVQMRRTFQEQSLAIEALPGCDYEWNPIGRSFPENATHASSPLGHVMVASHGRLLFSENGFEWCEVSTRRGEGFRDVLWDGRRFVALSNGNFFSGNPIEVHWYSRLATSPDGQNWSWQTGPNAQMYFLASNGDQVFAVGSLPSAQSTDPYTVYQLTAAGEWLPVFETSHHELTDLVWTGTNFFLFGRSEEQPQIGVPDTLWTSSDGAEWMLQNGADIDGSKMAASGSALVRVSNRFDRSQDGITWSPVDVALPEPMVNIAWGGSRFVAHGRTFAMTSQDGLQWSSAALPIELNDSHFELTWDGTIWLVTGEKGPVLWSSQGLDWRTIGSVEATDDQRNWTQALATEKGFITCGNRQTEGGVLAGSYVRESLDGITWEETSVHPEVAVYAIAQTPSGLLAGGANVNAPDFSGRLFLKTANGWQLQLNSRWPITHLTQLGPISLAFDDEGQSFRAEDAVSWYQAAKLPRVKRLQVAGGWFWAITQDGSLFRSLNANDWEALVLPAELGKLSAITLKGDQWLLLANEGATSQTVLATSENLQDWSFTLLNFATQYTQLAADGEAFYAMGSFLTQQEATHHDLPHAALVTSKDGVSWRPMNIPFFVPGEMRFGNLGGLLISEDQVFLKLNP